MPVRQKVGKAVILYIEDDTTTRENLSKFLQSQCHTLYTAVNGLEGFELFQKHKPDIVITDIEMPVMNGLGMARKIREVSLFTQIIIITAHKKPQYLMEAVNLQLVQYMLKPINLEKMVDALVLASKYLNREVLSTRKALTEDIFYDSYTKELVVNQKIVNLSKYERALMELMLSKHPAPISYDYIDAQIYDYGGSKNAIKLLVSSLREKIKKESVINVPGFGYKLNLKGDK